MKSQYVALIDCNNFYVSCERIFNPKLWGKPVIVLSNNDGCIIARSQEAKALGIAMGAAAFKYEKIFKKCNVTVLSSNFELYGDISARVMQTIADLVPTMEIYSIDEAFIDVSHIPLDKLVSYGQLIRAHVKKWTGIPISIGIASTKTLAKAANKLAKKNELFNGVCSLTSGDIDVLLDSLDVADTWGVGRKYAKMLYAYGIKTIKQLKYADDTFIKKRMNILGLRMVHELRGIACVDLQDVPELNKSIIRSRSFGYRVTTLSDLKEAVATYTSRAGESLREQKACCSTLQVFIMTSSFVSAERRYFNSYTCQLSAPTSYTPDLIHHALQALEKIFKPGYLYKKAGVILLDIIAQEHVQLNLFSTSENKEQQNNAMQAVDGVNEKWGKRSVFFAATGIQQRWKMQSSQRSQCYTTQWDELLVVKE